MTQELSGQKPQRPQTAAQLDAAYALVLVPLLADMGSDDAGRRASAESAIERVVFRASRPDAEAERLGPAAKAIAAVLDTRIGPPARVWLLRQLSGSAVKRPVPKVAALLADGDTTGVNRPAGPAEESSQGSQCRTAEGPLGSADTAWRVAVLNALGQVPRIGRT